MWLKIFFLGFVCLFNFEVNQQLCFRKILKPNKVSSTRCWRCDRGTAPCFVEDCSPITRFPSPLLNPVFSIEWPALETTSRACWALGMEDRSATGTAMERPCPQVGSPRRSSRPKRSAPAPWPCTTPSRLGRTASPSTGRSSSSERTTWSGSMLRKSLSGHILFYVFLFSLCTDDITLTLFVQSV